MKVIRPETGLGRSTAGFTLAEAVIAIAIATVALAGIINGYVMSAQRAEWSAYNLAAESLANQRLEQTRAAKWDPMGWPSIDQLTNGAFPSVVDILDMPIIGTNYTYATNFTTVVDLSTNPPLKLVRVDCLWSFQGRGVFTNTLVTYRAPDQ